jgi:hypothetical protein
MSFKANMIALSVTLVIFPIATHADATDERTVFVTSEAYNGALGGMRGADQKCRDAADAAGSIVPPGTYKAWISDGGESPGTRFTRASAPYVSADGETIIAEDYEDLVDGGIANPIRLTELGGEVADNDASRTVWTGVGVGGLTTGRDRHCTGWTTAGGLGEVGDTYRANRQWTLTSAYSCDNLRRLYCFQQ